MLAHAMCLLEGCVINALSLDLLGYYKGFKVLFPSRIIRARVGAGTASLRMFAGGLHTPFNLTNIHHPLPNSSGYASFFGSLFWPTDILRMKRFLRPPRGIEVWEASRFVSVLFNVRLPKKRIFTLPEIYCST